MRDELKQPEISIQHYPHSVPIVNAGIKMYSTVFWLLRFDVKLAPPGHFSDVR
jgi:hypothetical protein